MQVITVRHQAPEGELLDRGACERFLSYPSEWRVEGHAPVRGVVTSVVVAPDCRSVEVTEELGDSPAAEVLASIWPVPVTEPMASRLVHSHQAPGPLHPRGSG
jgi:hypothetical protein